MDSRHWYVDRQTFSQLQRSTLYKIFQFYRVLLDKKSMHFLTQSWSLGRISWSRGASDLQRNCTKLLRFPEAWVGDFNSIALMSFCFLLPNSSKRGQDLFFRIETILLFFIRTPLFSQAMALTILFLLQFKFKNVLRGFLVVFVYKHITNYRNIKINFLW